MKVIDKDNKDAGGVHLPFDAAIDALASGAYEAHPIEGERGPDIPAAQSPKPGTDPVDGKETSGAGAGDVLTNLAPVGVSDQVLSPGLPKEPTPPKENVVVATEVAPAPAVVVPAKVAAPAKPADK